MQSWLSKAGEAINRAERVFFYGISASNLIAHDMQHKFLRINKVFFTINDSHLQMASAAGLNERDVALGISYSGETDSVVHCIKTAKACKAVTISITKFGTNLLSSHADIPLFITSTENEIRSAATSSGITQLNLVDILYLGVASLNYDSSVLYLEKSRQAIRDYKVK